MNLPWILGIGHNDHNGSVCLMRGNRLVVAIQEERLSRQKRDSLSDLGNSLALEYCLSAAGIAMRDISVVVATTNNEPPLGGFDLGWPGRFLWIPHHAAHALGAYYQSGYDAAECLVVDGWGNSVDLFRLMGPPWVEELELAVADESPLKTRNLCETVSCYRISRTEITPVYKRFGAPEGERVFGTLGWMYRAVARYIFEGEDGPGKVMGLAPYGSAVFPPALFFEIRPGGRLAFKDEIFTAADRLETEPHGWPNNRALYADLAASVQNALEAALAFHWREVARLGETGRLCYSGGVALNSVANEKLCRRGLFEDVFFMPAAEDSGVAVGAAYYGSRLTGFPDNQRIMTDSTGITYGAAQIRSAIEAAPAVCTQRTKVVPDRVAELLDEGRVVGWFSGGSELGPRALGHRSILCDPRRSNAKDTLNLRVKHRESFRPFAPSVLREHAHEWFRIADHDDSPFMLRVTDCRPEKLAAIPGVVHVDGSARIHTVTQEANPEFHRLLSEFHRLSGVPVLLNTSFNVMGEPIVETPGDALWCLLFTGIDYVAFGEVIVGKEPGYSSILDLAFRREMAEVGLDSQRGTATPSTRWGRFVVSLSPLEVELLRRLGDDVALPGHALLRVCTDAGHDQEHLVRALGRLRRLRCVSVSRPDL